MQEAFTLAFGVHCQDFDDVWCFLPESLPPPLCYCGPVLRPLPAIVGGRLGQEEKKSEGRAVVSSLLKRVVTAAEERHLSQNTLTAYRRTGLKLIAWSAAEGLVHQTNEAVGQGNS